MVALVNIPISAFEHVVRSIYFPSQEDKRGNLKKYATFPVIKEDKDDPEYCNNKLSLLRVCVASGSNEYSPVVRSALSWENEKKKLKGFLEWSCQEIYDAFGSVRICLTPDASEKNPYHFHLVIEDLKVKYTSELKEKKNKGELSYSDLYPSDVHAALTRLREKGHVIKISNGQVENAVSPCWRCLDRQAIHTLASIQK